MQVGLDLARRYVERAPGLREALGLSDDAPLSIAPLGQGEHNANFVLADDAGRRFVLRINYESQLGLRDQASYEARALRLLAPSGVVPHLYLVDDTRSVIERGCLVIGYCAGEWLDYRRAGDVERAADLLAAVHAVPVPPDAPLLRPADPLAAQHRTCCAFIEAYRCSAVAQDWIVRLLEEFSRQVARALSAPFDAGEACHALNTEAVASHFLLPQEKPGEGAAAAGPRGSFVDWEKPVVGEVAQDVAYFLSPTTTIWDGGDFVFSPAERAAFVERYRRAVGGRFPLESFERRFGAYVKANCLLGLAWSANALVAYEVGSCAIRNEKTRARLDRYLCEGFLTLCKDTVFDASGDLL